VTDPETDDRDERLGTEVDRYTIVRLLGRGGMGAVYEARHARLGRRVAIKFLLPEMAARAELLRRFENEAVAAGGLEHPNLVAVIDLGRAGDGSPYLVMEYLPGEDCARLVRRAGPLPVARAVNVVLQACRGVAVAHDAGIVHRDLKPENLFVTDVGDGTDQIKVLDFGIAKLRPVDGQAATRTGSTFGTTCYMSPEQARGASEVDARTDVWSLGVVLYELLAGRKPFDGEQPLNVVHQILTTPAPPLDEARPGLPRALLAAVDKALQKDAGQRFPSIRAFMNALAPLAERPAPASFNTNTPASTQPSPETTGRPAARPRSARVGTAIALVAGMSIATIAFVGLRGKPAAPVAAAPAASPASAQAPAAPAAAAPAPVAVPVPVPMPAPAVAAAPAAPAKASGLSGQSEQPSPTPVAARRRRDPAGRRSGAPTVAEPTSRSPPPPEKPALKLDPNPY
jgi:serine/threonine-protein kinase